MAAPSGSSRSIGTVFALAHFSEAFLILRARDAGLPLALSPLVLVAMNVVYALSAYPAGALSDACDRLIVLALGLALLIAADLVLAGSSGLIGVSIGVLLWGLHMGLTQGLLATLVADVAAAELRGTAFGMFNLLSGLATLAASLIAGDLWDRHGAQATFCAGAAFAAAGARRAGSGEMARAGAWGGAWGRAAGLASRGSSQRDRGAPISCAFTKDRSIAWEPRISWPPPFASKISI